MLLYVTLGTNDLEGAGRFYDGALQPLGFRRQKQDEDGIGYSRDGDIRCRLWVVTPYDRKPACFGNGVTIALEAESRQAVDAFHAAALTAGGHLRGTAGARPFHAHFYAAFVRDPDGNKLSAVCERSE